MEPEMEPAPAFANNPNVDSTISGTPVHKRSSSLAGNQSTAGHIEVKTQMARELRKEFVGPMPIEQFFEDFLEVDLDDMPLLEPNHFDRLPRATSTSKKASAHAETTTTGRNGGRVTETDLYDIMIKLVREAGLMKDFDLVNTSQRPDKYSDKKRRWQPDLSTYDADDSDSDDSDRMDCNADDDNPNDFSRNQCPWEFKTVDTANPFTDPPKNATTEQRLAHVFLSGGKDGALTRGQMAAVLTEVCARQHRTHAFLIFVGDPEVRILRADRAGVVVSEAINFRTHSQLFAEFLYRFSKATPTQRGIDPSVQLSNAAEEGEARASLAPFQKQGLGRPTVTIDVPDPKCAGGIRKVVACGSLTDPHALTGRATRAYAVYDLQDGKIKFLKDTWRADVEGMEKESDIMALLNQANVDNVPTMTCGDDVQGEYSRTRTQGYINEDWVAGVVGNLAPRVHHRILEDFVPYKIYDFRTPEELLTVVHHAFIAHRQAYERCGILHRDVSDNNVMITDERKGILTDWDLSIRLQEHEDDSTSEDKPGWRKPRQRYRTGTWCFMSSRLLMDPYKIHTLQDDIESFLHLVLLVALQTLPIYGIRGGLKNLISDVFESSTWDDILEEYTGGDAKRTMIRDRAHISPDFCFPGNDALTRWVNLVLGALKEYYDYIAPQPTCSLRDDSDAKPQAEMTLIIKDHALVNKAFLIAIHRKDDNAWADNRLRVPSPRPDPPSPLLTRQAKKISQSASAATRLKNLAPRPDTPPQPPLAPQAESSSSASSISSIKRHREEVDGPVTPTKRQRPALQPISLPNSQAQRPTSPSPKPVRRRSQRLKDGKARSAGSS